MKIFYAVLALSIATFFASEDTNAEKICTVDDDVLSTTLTIDNIDQVPRQVFWVSEEEEEIFLGEVPAHDTLLFNTFVGHVFTLRGGNIPDETMVVPPVCIERTSEVVDDDDNVERLAKLDHEQIMSLSASFSTALPVKFRNLSGKHLSLWYDMDGISPGIKQGHMPPGGDSTTNSYPGHSFCFVELHSEDGCVSPLGRVTVNEDDYTYAFDDGSGSAFEYERWADEDSYSKQYKEKTGQHWITFYPRNPPVLFMHEADFLNDTIHRVTRAPLHPKPSTMQDPSVLTLRVVSTKPRAFVIDHFLTDEEVEHIVSRGRARVERSLTGQNEEAFASTTRTSKNTWIRRDESPVMERIFVRAADLLGLDDKLLNHDDQGGNAEQLQLVHYDVGEKYDAHYDWGVDPGGASRFVTLLLYLSDFTSGGQTYFPKAQLPNGSPPLAVHPGKGAAVLFYNLLSDGNADHHALHAALPVLDGEKWLANFWIWDPMKIP